MHSKSKSDQIRQSGISRLKANFQGLPLSVRWFHYVSLHNLSGKVKPTTASTVFALQQSWLSLMIQIPAPIQIPGKVKNPYPNVDAHSGQLMHFYNLRRWDWRDEGCDCIPCEWRRELDVDEIALKDWLVVWNMFYVPINIGNNHPNWLSYFSEGSNHQPEDVYHCHADIGNSSKIR